MTCLRVPLSLDDASVIITECTGHADWRPLFVLGLGSVFVFVLLLVVVLGVIRSLR